MFNVSIVSDWTSFEQRGFLENEHRYFADGFALSASVVSLFVGDTTTTLKAMYGVALIAMGGWVYACSYVNTLEDWAHMTAFRFLPYMGSAVTNKAELRGNYTPVWVVVTVVHVLLLHVALVRLTTQLVPDVVLQFADAGNAMADAFAAKGVAYNEVEASAAASAAVPTMQKYRIGRLSLDA